MKKKFKVQVFWQMGAIVEVEAESLPKGIQLVREVYGVPTDGEYVSDSFEIDHEITDMLNGQDN